MMNRRQFIKRAGAFLAGLPLFGTALRGVTKEMPVTLANPSVALHNEPTRKWGIAGRQVMEGIEAGLTGGPYGGFVVHSDENGFVIDFRSPAEREEARRIESQLPGCQPEFHIQTQECKGKTIFVNESQDGPGDDNNDGLSMETPLRTRQAAIDKVDCYPGYYPVGIGDDSTMRRMSQIMLDSPEITREQAFFQAVMERAERIL